MPGFTRLYKFSIDQEMVKNIAAKNHVNSLNLATILEMLGKKILMQLYGSKETAAWNVTTTTYMKRDDVGNETDDLKHLVRMSTNKDSLYKRDNQNGWYKRDRQNLENKRDKRKLSPYKKLNIAIK